GWIAGGPGEVLAGVLDVIGPDGTLMMYVGWEGSSYDFLANVPEVPPALLQLWPAYDPTTSRAMHEWSILTECLRTWPGAQRSQHPDSSFAAVGRLADDLTRDHPLNYGMGEGSPLAKLCQHEGNVLLLGAPLSALTLLHHAEHLADVADKQIVRYKAPILSNGQKEWIDIEEFDTSQCLPWQGSADLFEAIARQYLQEGQGIVGRVGAAASYLFDAAALNDFAVTWIEETFREPQEPLGDVQVRLADDRDHRELVTLFAAMEEERTGTPVSASRLSPLVDELLEDRNRRILIAETQDKTLGMLVALAEPEKEGVLEYTFVTLEHRRQGILRELEIDASAFFIERGCSSIGLDLDPD
ncbi:aminoglycoside 3-N-acetyltransferase, partial [Candidatus Bipolaricaulota bacterium]|nr:aminoglycoside 3-N-acetyltransferase [Candidatus Bipolaricaulota bacterium]